MLSEKDVMTWQEHYKDLYREAEQARIVRQALASKQTIHLRQRALAWLGSFFVAWGCYLRRRNAFGVIEGEATASFNPTSGTDCGCAS